MLLIDYFIIRSAPEERFYFDRSKQEFICKKYILDYKVIYYFQPPLLWARYLPNGKLSQVGLYQIDYSTFKISCQLPYFCGNTQRAFEKYLLHANI